MSTVFNTAVRFQSVLRFQQRGCNVLQAAFSSMNCNKFLPCTNYTSWSRMILCPKSLVVTSSNFSVNTVRFRGARKEKPVDWLPFPWVWPPKFDVFENSGDLVSYNEVDSSLPKPDFELSDELKNADGNVKRVFSAVTTTVREKAEINKREILMAVQRHPLDFDSLEVKIALMTIKVRKLFELKYLHKKDIRIKVALMIAIQRRNKLLKALYRTDSHRFNWLSKVLKVEYVPRPMGIVKERYTKKWDLRRLTREYCISLKNQKLAIHHEEIKAQQENFLREKADTLAWIVKEEKELGMKHSD